MKIHKNLQILQSNYVTDGESIPQWSINEHEIHKDIYITPISFLCAVIQLEAVLYPLRSLFNEAYICPHQLMRRITVGGNKLVNKNSIALVVIQKSSSQYWVFIHAFNYFCVASMKFSTNPAVMRLIVNYIRNFVDKEIVAEIRYTCCVVVFFSIIFMFFLKCKNHYSISRHV